MNVKHLIFAIIAPLLFVNCSSDNNSIEELEESVTISRPTVPFQNEIKRFIFSALNSVYLYSDEVPDFSEDRFDSQRAFNTFLNNTGSPEDFFERLIVPKDRFSYIINNYEEQQAASAGQSVSSGLKFEASFIDDTRSNLILIVTDVLPDSPADIAGIKRGFLINKINGQQLNVNNFNKLFDDTSFTLGQANLFQNESIISTDNSFELTKVTLIESPIRLSEVLEVDNRKIGYLLYNSFSLAFEEQLNAEFLKFKTAGVTDFILDLRYNGGGNIITANALTGMITGDLVGQVITREQWNSELQEVFQNETPEILTDTFVETTVAGNPLHSIGMKKLYVITSKSQTASASELVINSLRPYIDVVVVGDPKGTVGKSQASITVYDSEDLSREKANPNHKYAMQPLVFKTVNSNSVGVPEEGIFPDILGTEDFSNLGQLGNIEEPLLKLALDDITGNSTPSAKRISILKGKYFGNSEQDQPTYQRMYTSKKIKNNFK